MAIIYQRHWEWFQRFSLLYRCTVGIGECVGPSIGGHIASLVAGCAVVKGRSTRRDCTAAIATVEWI